VATGVDAGWAGGFGVGATVGCGVGTGVGGGGLGVGTGVGGGGGAVIVSEVGLTLVSCTVTSPLPVPDVALKKYVRSPTGSVMVRAKVVPPEGAAPAEVSGNVPTPEIVTVMLIGSQPALSS
jgi:hypothetical protein